MFRRQTTICREGLYYLVITALVLGGAMLKEVNLLLILAGMLLGPMLLNWRAVGPAITRRRGSFFSPSILFVLPYLRKPTTNHQ